MVTGSRVPRLVLRALLWIVVAVVVVLAFDHVLDETDARSAARLSGAEVERVAGRILGTGPFRRP